MFKFKNITLLIFVIIIVTYIDAYRILGVFPFNAKSHDMMFNALMTGLAKRNHQVDVITHFPPKNPSPNYQTIINLNGTLNDMQNKLPIDFITKADMVQSIGVRHGNSLCHFLGLEEMQKLIKNPPNDPPYDLVIVETFGANCFMGLGHVLKVPVIGVSSSVEFPWVADFSGNNDNLAYVSSYFMENFDKSKFLHRLMNFISHHWYKFRFHRVTGEEQTNLMRKYLSSDIPNIRDVEKSVALLLINRYPVMDGLKPVATTFIEVSGLHLEENYTTKLPTDLQKWLDESNDGVVYVSFGSMVLIETLPVDVILAMYKSFAKIAPIRVLMKIVDKSKLPAGLPENVKVLPWFPQRAVLSHKNVRVFLSHGGLMGTQETLYHGVPVIGIPLFSDQPQNIDKLVAMNMGVKIRYNNLTTSSLNEALSAVLNNPMYRENAKKHSKLFKDRPMKAMDTAVFWIEYVIRNGNVLKSAGFELSWWQLALLDIYVFILISLISSVALIYYVMNHLTKKIIVLIVQKYVLKQIKKVKVQ